MPSGQQIPFEPAFALCSLSISITRPAGARNSSFGTVAASHWRSVASKSASRPFDSVSSGPKRENCAAPVQLGNIAQETPKDVRISNAMNPRRRHVDCVLAEIRHSQVAQQNATVGMRVRTHALLALRSEFGQFRLSQPAVFIKELLRPVALQPIFQHLQVFGMGSRVRERHLVRPERAFNLQSIHYSWRPSSPLAI